MTTNRKSTICGPKGLFWCGPFGQKKAFVDQKKEIIAKARFVLAKGQFVNCKRCISFAKGTICVKGTIEYLYALKYTRM